MNKPTTLTVPSAFTEEKIAIAIGQLRQWLNEDRIKDANKFVTNEELKHWLYSAIEELIKECEKRTREETIIEVRKLIARNLSYDENSDLDPTPELMITEGELFVIFRDLLAKLKTPQEKGG